jgi:hypothetical protein
MKLNNALICIDCNILFDRTVTQTCPACTNKHGFPISMWLDRALMLTQTSILKEEGGGELT